MKRFKLNENDNKLLNELYKELLVFDIKTIEDYYNKYFTLIDFNISKLIDKDVDDIRKFYQRYFYQDLTKIEDKIIYNSYLNDINYLVKYILHNKNQFINDRKDLMK